MRNALKPGGIVCSQAGTAWANLDIVKNTLKIAHHLYPVAEYAVCNVPTYPTGQIGFVIAGLSQVRCGSVGKDFVMSSNPDWENFLIFHITYGSC